MKDIVVTRMRFMHGEDTEVEETFKGEKFEIIEFPNNKDAWLLIYDEAGDLIVQTKNFESVIVRNAE